MNLFTPVPNDQSIHFLGQIFGYMQGVLGSSSGASLSILSTIFKVFNTAALTVGAFIVIYVTVVGLIKTASEGEFLGKQWNSLWVPVRTVMGIALLFPTASGYSAIQVIFMWIILQGIGLADTVWTTAINYTAFVGGPGQAQPAPSDLGNAEKFKGLFAGLMCQSTAAINNPRKYTDADDKTIFYCGMRGSEKFCRVASDGDLSSENARIYNISDSDMLRSTHQTGQQVYQMGPDGACGSLTYCDPDTSAANTPCADAQSQACYACRAQKDALQQIVSVFGPMSYAVAKADSDYINFWYALGSSNVTPWIKKYCADKGIDEKDCCINGVLGEPCKAVDQFGNWTENRSYATSGLINYLYYPYVVVNTFGDADYVKAATTAYTNGLLAGINSFISEGNVVLEKGSWEQKAKDTGWLYAGIYYYQMARSAKQSTALVTPEFNVEVKTIDTGSILYNYRNNMTAGRFLVDKISTPADSNSGPGVAPPPALAKVYSDLESTAHGIANNFMRSMTDTGSGQDAGAISGSGSDMQRTDPIAKVAKFGSSLIITAEVLWSVFVISAFVIIMATNTSVFALGTGIIGGWGSATIFLYLVMLPLFTAFIAALFAFGGLLAVYVPLIPYIIFTLGAIGWFIGVIEAMFAAPFVALGILMPGGHHEVMGKAEPALMMIFNLFLRPALMVAGMLAAMVLVTAVVTMINAGFLAVMGKIGEHPSTFELILFIAVYASIIVTAISKCFTLIHYIPERVLTWIGGQAISYGEEQGLGAIKHGAEAAGGTLGGGVSGTGGAIRGGAKESAEYLKEREAQKSGKGKPEAKGTGADAGENKQQ